MDGVGGFGAPGGSGVGPSPGVAAAMAQRLAGIAGEVDALRLQLVQIALLDWKSPAASTFLNELNGRIAGMVALVRAIDSAASEVQAYGFMLDSGAQNGQLQLPGVPAPGRSPW